MLPLVSINLVVYNEERRVRDCLKAVFNQTYKNIEVLVFDNGSTDKTTEIVKNEFSQVKIFKAEKNYGFGPGQNRAAKIISGKYIVGLCADVWLKEDFVEEAVKIMDKDEKIGALQAKIYRLADTCPQTGTQRNEVQPQGCTRLNLTDIIDTCGFEIYKSRRIVNRGHGMQCDKINTGDESPPSISMGYDEIQPFGCSRLNLAEEIFSYEGACPFWRRAALDDTAIFGEYHDEDYFWYGDDIDLGWRMHLLGWKNFFAPQVVAWHERQTTKRLSSGKWDFIRQRKTLPKKKRMLDWVNTHLTFVKNDIGLLMWPDIAKFISREAQLFIYALVFEPYTIIVGLPRLIKYLPRALKKRKEIMRRRKVSVEEIKKWYLN